MHFDQLQFHPTIAQNLSALGFINPTPIQREAIPHVRQGRDVMGLAQTGTGKTAAFALPIIERLMSGPKGEVRALVLAPTRELAEQIHEDFQELARHTGLRSCPVYGGVGMREQIHAFDGKAEIIVACPGRLLDHLGRRTADLASVEVLVLDEADRMLDMGFLPDIRRILQRLPAQRQTLMFSATMPPSIRGLAHECLRDPITVQVDHHLPVTTVSHAVYPVPEHRKSALLLEILRQIEGGSVLVFTRTKHGAKRLASRIAAAGHTTASMQGNLSQGQRRQALDGFRSGRYRVLVATDIAARGIDISDITHVINYDMPDTTESYTHRIGRTGRAAKNGDAYTLVSGKDEAMIRQIERALGRQIERRTIAGFDYGTSTAREFGARREPAIAAAAPTAPAVPKAPPAVRWPQRRLRRMRRF